jgi:hypothetical protein
VRAKKEKKKDVLRVRSNRRIQHLESPSRERKEPKKNGEKKTKFRPSRTPRAMKSKHAQTRYQLVQTYFINISTTNHRARAVRIHPSRAVFRKDEKFSEPLHFRRKPKKIIIQRAQAKSERARYFSLHSRARDTNYALSSLSLSLSLSLEKLIIIADDNKRECSALTFAILFLCLCSMF